MKTPVLFKEYIWLVNTIYRAGKISFSEINEKWLRTEMSGGVDMARTTFNRHKDAIEDIFGIIIECDKKDGFKYYIANKSVLREDTIQNWMLSSLTVHTAVQEGVSLQKRILLEDIPSGYKYLQPILEAMKCNHCIDLTYQKYNGTEAKQYSAAEPYCLKIYKRRWYLLAKSGQLLMTFSLDRIRSLEIKEESFQLDKDFDAEAFFNDYYGVYRDEKTPPQQVVIRATDEERPYLRDLPLHHSQKEICTTADYSDFAYFLSPSDDFIAEILRKRNRLCVVAPPELHQKVARYVKEMGKNYEEQKKV